MLNLIVAIARNGVIGKNNQIPWHLPADLKYFRDAVAGKTVLFGQNTYYSVKSYYAKAGKTMPYGKIIVLSDVPCFRDPNVVIVRSKQEVLRLAKLEEIWICGGMGVYTTFLEDADKYYITWVEANIDGDAYFPAIDFSKLKEVSAVSRLKDEKNAYDLTFTVYKRKKLTNSVSRNARKTT